MPFARAAVRQTGGRTPLGLVEKGMGALIVTEVVADAMVMQAIKRAYEERGVKVYIVSEDELLGINREEAQGDQILFVASSRCQTACGSEQRNNGQYQPAMSKFLSKKAQFK
jgi:hypothetical protein